MVGTKILFATNLSMIDQCFFFNLSPIMPEYIKWSKRTEIYRCISRKMRWQWSIPLAELVSMKCMTYFISLQSSIDRHDPFSTMLPFPTKRKSSHKLKWTHNASITENWSISHVMRCDDVNDKISPLIFIQQMRKP